MRGYRYLGLGSLSIFCIAGSVGFFILGTTLGLEDLGIFCTEGSADFSNLGTNLGLHTQPHRNKLHPPPSEMTYTIP